MWKISNKVLLAFVFIALAISIVTTLISLQRLDGLSGITGRLSASDSGTVLLSVPEVAYVNITNQTIDLVLLKYNFKTGANNLMTFLK